MTSLHRTWAKRLNEEFNWQIPHRAFRHRFRLIITIMIFDGQRVLLLKRKASTQNEAKFWEFPQRMYRGRDISRTQSVKHILYSAIDRCTGLQLTDVIAVRDGGVQEKALLSRADTSACSSETQDLGLSRLPTYIATACILVKVAGMRNIRLDSLYSGSGIFEKHQVDDQHIFMRNWTRAVALQAFKGFRELEKLPAQ